MTGQMGRAFLRGGQLVRLAVLAALVLAPSMAEAALPQLRIAPLRYDEHLELGTVKTGFIDASNPTGSALRVVFQVQAFRQVNDEGELEYYDDERLASAIVPAIGEFDLGPREAVRVKFTIDPNKLGPGGAYGVIFLRTADVATEVSRINTSARVGTLLILDVGGAGVKNGRLTGLKAPGLVYGNTSLPVTLTYANSGQGPEALAFAPVIETRLGWFGDAKKSQGPFVFPGRSRQGLAELTTGNRLGLVPVTVRDVTGGGSAQTRWMVMVTGVWTWLFPLGAFVALGGLWCWFRLRRGRRQRFLAG